MTKVLSIAAFALLLGAAPSLAQTSNKSGDASNAQQNGDNTQTQTGGQSGGASGRQ